MRHIVLSLLLICSGVSSGVVSAGGLLSGNLPDFTPLVEKVGPTVVNISTKYAPKKSHGRQLPELNIPGFPNDHQFNELFRHFFGEQGGLGGFGDGFGRNNGGIDGHKTQSLGSGVIISSDGYILTNHHVIDKASEIIVKLADGRELVAEVIGSDSRTDVALIKISATGLPAAKLGRKKPAKVGEWVMAIGSPFGFDYSATVGIISATGRSLPKENYVPFLQTDVAINPGNSGGPLFDLDGNVIGVNSMIYSKSGGFMGLSFAIPIEIAMNVVDQLRDNGKVSRGWLGVLIQDVTRELAESFGMEKPDGALVAQIMEDGPAANSDLQVGDIILKFNGKPVSSNTALPPIVGQVAAGSSVPVIVLRKGSKKKIMVTVGELPDESDNSSQVTKNGKQQRVDKRLGVAVSNPTKEQRKRVKVRSGGVVIDVVENDSPAQRAGIRAGDMLVMLAGVDIQNTNHFASVLKKLPAGKTVLAYVVRESGAIFIAIKLLK